MEKQNNENPHTNNNVDYVSPIPNYLEKGLENFFRASKEFRDGYRNENGTITRINIAALSAALNQAETELKKCYNRYKAHSGDNRRID